MIIRRISPLTYRTHSLDLKLTEEQYLDWALGDATPEQAMPDLTPDEREFVTNGIHPDEWLPGAREKANEEVARSEKT